MSNIVRIARYQTYNYRINFRVQTVSQAPYSCFAAQQIDANNHIHSKPVCFAIDTRRNKSFAAIAANIQTTLSQSDSVAVLQNALIEYHDFTNLPWWASIITYTFLLRLILLPLQVYTLKIHARIDRIMKHDLPIINAKVTREVNSATVRFKFNKNRAELAHMFGMKTELKELYIRDNCHPFKTAIVLWLQIPLWLCQSVAIRNIASLRPDPNSVRAMIVLAQISVGGVLWIPSLIAPDVSYILPLWLGLINLANIELMQLEKKGGPKLKLAIAATAFGRCISILTIPICASVPSCLAVYWCTSSTMALATNLALLSPRVKRLLRIPTNTTYHMEQPYRTIAQRFVEQMTKRKSWCSRVILRTQPTK